MRIDISLNDFTIDDFHKFYRFIDKKMIYYDLNFDKVESNENWLELSAKDHNVEFNIKIRRN